MINLNYNSKGIFSNNKQISNFTPIVVTLVYNSQQSDNINPNMLAIIVLLDNGEKYETIVPYGNDIVKSICKQCPKATIYSGTNNRQYIKDFIFQQVSGDEKIIYPLNNEEIKIQNGYLFPSSGTYTLPSGQRVVIWNSRVAGNNQKNIPFYTRNSSSVIIEDKNSPIKTMVNAILENDCCVTLPLAFAMLVSRRDVVSDMGYPLRGGLYITAPQGAGKTTLARQMLGYVVTRQNTKNPALFMESVSTEAAVRDSLSQNPGCVVIIDDLCKSSSRAIEKKRRELGSAVLRLAANEGDSAKKDKQGETQHNYCSGGIALTAEFVLDGHSELTRSIFVNITEPLQLTKEIQPSLTGGVLSCFADWFANNYDTALEMLMNRCENPDILDVIDLNNDPQYDFFLRERRIRDNFSLMRWAFDCFIAMARKNPNFSLSIERALYTKFWEAVRNSLAKQLEVLNQLQTKTKEGNIAYLLKQAIDSKRVFNVCKKKDRNDLHTMDGIIWKKDSNKNILEIGLRQTSIVQFIRHQNGYQDYTSRKILQQLRDDGALILQEDNSFTVHLGKRAENGKTNLPRVVLIKYDVLSDCAKKY